MKSYKIITFGCQMNEHDSEIISGMLTQRGYSETEKDPDIVIINTCSIRENADKRFFGTLGQMKKIKLVNPDFAVCVCGCMMQQEHITKKLRQSYPWVDVVFGTHNIHEFPDMLEQLYENRSKAADLRKAASAVRSSNWDAGSGDVCGDAGREKALRHTSGSMPPQIRSSKDVRVDRIYEDRDDIVEGLPAKRLYGHKSFVNIMYGCNNFCTYCVVPYTRGREKSRHPEDILDETRRLAADGVKEVTLLGQNVNSYRGVSKDGKRVWDFTDLIYALNNVEGPERIRFMTSHPKDLSDRLIEAFAKCDKLCKYIHLPVQSGSSSVLKRMNRRYTREQYLELIHKLREAVPGIAISTDIIVGFPGETEEEFEDTLTLVKEVSYDSAFTFLYSPRKGTPAAEYDEQIAEEIKHERFDRLVNIMNEGSKIRNEAFVGRICDVLVDGPDKKESGILNGRTEEFKLVDFRGSEKLIGSIVRVEITDSNTFSLRGKLCDVEADMDGELTKVQMSSD